MTRFSSAYIGQVCSLARELVGCRCFVGGRSVVDADKGHELKTFTGVKEGVTCIVTGSERAGDIFTTDDEIKVIEEVDELKCQIELEVPWCDGTRIAIGIEIG